MKYTAVFPLLPFLASFASAAVQVTISPEAELVAGKYNQRIDISKQQFHLNRDGSLPADTRFTVKLGLSDPFVRLISVFLWCPDTVRRDLGYA